MWIWVSEMKKEIKQRACPKALPYCLFLFVKGAKGEFDMRCEFMEHMQCHQQVLLLIFVFPGKWTHHLAKVPQFMIFPFVSTLRRMNFNSNIIFETLLALHPWHKEKKLQKYTTFFIAIVPRVWISFYFVNRHLT